MGELLTLILLALLVYWLIRRRRRRHRPGLSYPHTGTGGQERRQPAPRPPTSTRHHDPEDARRSRIIDRHFELNQEVEMAKAAGDFDLALTAARRSVDQLRDFVVAWNEQRLADAQRVGVDDSDLDWQVVKMPALETIHQIAPARCEGELISHARSVVAEIPGMEDEVEQLDRDLEDVEACNIVLQHLSENPGVKQAGMARGLGLDGHRVKSLLHWMERDGEIVRVPDGKTHRLYLPGDAPETDDDLAVPTGPGLNVGLEPTSVELAAVDVETATSDRSSACAIAVALVSDGRVADTRRWYVRPPDNAYRASNVKIHGIQPHETADAPPFPQVWREAQQLVEGLDLVAHNAPFDASVVRRSLEHHGVAPPPGLDVLCTCRIARRLWPELPNHTLPVVSAHCGAPVERHHDPVADAAAAASIAIAICSTLEVDSMRKADELSARPRR